MSNENDASLAAEKSAMAEPDLVTSPAAEIEPVRQQQSPLLLHRDDEALASAENENNMNVESENNSNVDRPAGQAASVDVSSDPQISENDVNLQSGEMQDSVATGNSATSNSKMEGDRLFITERSDVAKLCTRENADVCETKSVREDAVLSSVGEMVIDVHDHEFSEEELEDEGKTSNIHVPTVQPLSDKSMTGQRRQSGHSRSVTSEKNQPTTATRVIRLNRNFSQSLTQSVDMADCQAESQGKSGHKILQKPAVTAKRSKDDASTPRTKLTNVPCGNDSESIMPKQLKLGSTPPQLPQKLAASKNVAAGVSKTQTRSADTSAVKVKSKSPKESGMAAGSTAMLDECKTERQQQVLDNEQSDVTPESIQPHDKRDGSSESDSLTKTQLEILELEMRARAIKAMIRAHEEMEQLESAENKRHSSGAEDLSGLSKRHVLSSSSNVQSPSVSRRHSELRSLQSVVGRSIIKRAEVVARHQERFQQRKQFVDQRRLPQAAFTASRRTFGLQSNARVRPIHYVVTSASSPRIVHLPSARFAAPLPFSPRQRQRRFKLRRNLASSDNSRDDKRRVLVSSSQRSVRLSSSGRPY